jgi:putative transposase
MALTSGQSPSSASDADWAEAVRREAVIRPLSAVSRLKSHLVAEASRKLGLSNRRIYGLLDGFRKNPVTASLLPRKSGPKKGARQLDAKVDAQIEAAIEDVYLKREQSTLRIVLREVARNCRTAGLTPPSMKALRARVSARGLRERMKAREGAEAAAASTWQQERRHPGPL